MADEKYNLVFRGELVRGADPEQARRNIGQLFKVSEAQVNALFSGKPVVLKKNLDFATANKYRVAIKKAGCRVDLDEQQSAKPAPAQGGKAVFAVPDGPAAAPQAAAPAPKAPEPAEPATPRPQVNADAPPPPPLPEVEEVDAAEFDLAPTGSTLLSDNEREPVQAVSVDVSGYTVRELEGELLDDSEKTPFVERQIHVDASLAPVGADVLQDSEREQVDPVSVDISGLSVADAGEDLGQIKEEVEEKRPDISHLSVESPN